MRAAASLPPSADDLELSGLTFFELDDGSSSDSTPRKASVPKRGTAVTGRKGKDAPQEEVTADESSEAEKVRSVPLGPPAVF